jgi:uncharacterized protein (UPF0335 family)
MKSKSKKLQQQIERIWTIEEAKKELEAELKELKNEVSEKMDNENVLYCHDWVVNKTVRNARVADMDKIKEYLGRDYEKKFTKNRTSTTIKVKLEAA